MLFPIIKAWMKQMHNSIGYGIHARKVGTFEGVTSVKCKGQILKAVIDQIC